jgi:hypothetical protein
MNTSGGLKTGRLNIFADDGAALPVRQLDGATDWSFAYSILPGGAYVFQTDASPADVKVGWVELTPGDGMPAPAAAGIFRYSRNGILLTETGIPPATLTTHARMFVDLSGGHDTGLAIANPRNTPLGVSLTAFQTNGINPVGENTWPLLLRGHGHTAAFVDQLISRLPAGFRGVLDIVGDSPFAALTLRSLVNERSDFLLTTFPVADMNQAAPFPIIFPQIADGGGYRTEFIFLGAGQSGSARVEFFGDDGTPVAIGP